MLKWAFSLSLGPKAEVQLRPTPSSKQVAPFGQQINTDQFSAHAGVGREDSRLFRDSP
jgi:hypothetical protein